MALGIIRKSKPKSRYSKSKSTKTFSSRRFSGRALLLYGLIFAGIGGAVLYRTFAATTLYSCFGAPADYVAKFDAKDGLTDGKVSYPEPRWFDEQQTWATPAGETPGHHSEHVHVGRCIPNGVAWTSASRNMDVVFTFHNMVDYKILGGGSTAGYPPGANAMTTKVMYSSSDSQRAQLQAAADASGAGAVQKVYISYPVTNPSVNGWKEARGAVAMEANGPNAIFPKWSLDARWYPNDAISGLPSYGDPGTSNQIAVRNRAIVDFCKPDGSVATCGTIVNDYHHSGYCGMTGSSSGTTIGTGSSTWNGNLMAKPWVGDRDICLYVTDGGGPATLMIDPDFHNHYAAPTESCPNVDANGNCLGKWFWQPNNTRKEIFSGPGLPQYIHTTVPGSVLANLAPGLHKLVFLSSDQGDCIRQGRPCPADMRGTWTNVSVLPFMVQGVDTQAPSVPTGLVKSNPTSSSINLAWAPSTDNVAVTGYRVYKDGVLFKATASRLITVSGLSAASHKLEVESYDYAGNKSARAAVSVTRSWK